MKLSIQELSLLLTVVRIEINNRFNYVFGTNKVYLAELNAIKTKLEIEIAVAEKTGWLKG